MRTATRSDALPTNGPSDTNTANAMTNSAPATTASVRHAVLGAWIGPWSRAPGVEAAVVYSLIVLFIWWIQLWFRPFVVLLLGAVIASHVIRRESPRKIGFRLNNLRACFAEYGPLVLLIAGGALASGALLHTFRPLSAGTALGILAGYVVWGLFQQYVLNGYFTNRFMQVIHGPAAAWLVPLLAGLCFAGAHALNWYLMAVTFVAGTLSAIIYMRSRNLFFLGIAHGVVGTALFLVSPDSIAHHFMVGPGMMK
ncbi:MAG TPA: CPBP family intramembrane glutamic endopeptidase [Gemmatimonadaceae bacterium]|nr:CPBP family intramembrane glutamic endopeptidase [Gemmatimonadaceae bacterium]